MKPVRFTAVLLVAEGLCSLDDPVVKYLPDLDDHYPAYGPIRLRHLASMSSGYRGQVVNVTTEQPWGEPISYLEPGEPLFEPGTQDSITITRCSCWVAF